MNRSYKCPKCGEFDHYRKDDKIITVCPECGSPIKQLLGCMFKLVGHGFYSTDNVKVG